MLSASVGILNGTSIGGGNYTMNVYFEDGSKAKFLRVGDTVRDRLGNEYLVSTWSVYPSDFASGGQITSSFITSDTAPATSSGYDATVFTPGQVDVRSPVRTSGVLGSASIYSGQNYEYSVSASWSDGVEAAQAIVGDSIVDSEGKEFEISYLSTGRFAQPFRVIEVIKEGQAPAPGAASLYRPTSNYGLFQGTQITDPARTVVRNRDDFILDAAIATSGGGGGSGAEITFTNDSGSTIIKGTPVRVDVSGNIGSVDVSTESDAISVIGIAKANIANGADGTIVTNGLLENITISASVQDVVYVSKSGALTNAKPDIGVDGFVEGDFVVCVGVVSENQSNPLQKDLIVNISVVGQL